MGVGGQCHTTGLGGQSHSPAALPPAMTGAHCTGCWVGEKNLAFTRFASLDYPSHNKLLY